MGRTLNCDETAVLKEKFPHQKKTRARKERLTFVKAHLSIIDVLKNVRRCDRLAAVEEEIKDLNEEICQLLENNIQQNQSETENRRLRRLDGGN